jgi:3D (Asp-Asp-Asp) domain-containing protein
MKGISHSLWRKLVATFVVSAGFVLLYQATIRDSRNAAEQARLGEGKAEPGVGVRLRFQVTAYCKGDVTASGVPPQSGIAAADPDVLPTGSVIQVSNMGPRYDGIYTIMDTGPVIKGRLIDLYMWSCVEALEFGRRSVEVVVLRLGWNPQASGPSFLDTLFPWRDGTAPVKPPAGAAPASAPPAGAAPRK